MYHIKEDHMSEIEIKKSRFLCYLHSVNNEEEAKQFVSKIKKEHPSARHHCYAFIIGEQNEIQRSNDDGEPSGTAGSPMLECLSKQRMQDMIAVTVRYFGGVKLGAGGLIRAYSKSVSNALNSAVLTRKQRMLEYQLDFTYTWIGKLDYYFREHEINVYTKTYGEMVHYEFRCIKPIDEDLSELTGGSHLPIFIKEIMIDVDI